MSESTADQAKPKESTVVCLITSPWQADVIVNPSVPTRSSKLKLKRRLQTHESALTKHLHPSKKGPQERRDRGQSDLRQSEPGGQESCRLHHSGDTIDLCSSEDSGAEEPLPGDGQLPFRSFREEQAGSKRTCAYAKHLTLVLERVLFRDDYRLLFTSEEQDNVQRLLSYLEDVRSVYARLLQRKGPWFRSLELRNYLQDTCSLGDLAKVLQILVDGGFLRGLNEPAGPPYSKASFSDLFEVLEQLQHKELQTLLGHFRPRTSSSKSSVNTKGDCLETLKTLCLQQRQINGRCLPLAFRIKTMLRKASSQKEEFDVEDQLLMVRLTDGPALLFKRIFRLFYLSSSNLLMSQSPTATAGEASGASKIGDGQVEATSLLYCAHSHGGAPFWPGLLSAFGKLRYPQYTCQQSTAIFPSRVHFVCYELAIELRSQFSAAVEERIILATKNTTTRACKRENSCTEATADPATEIMSLIDEWHTPTPAKRSLHPTLQLMAALIHKSLQDGLQIWEFSDVVKGFGSLPALPNDGEAVDEDDLLGAVQEASRLYHLYTFFEASSARPRELRDLAIQMGSSENVSSPGVSSFFDRFSAAYQIAAVLKDALPYLERKREYVQAVCLIVSLLMGPYHSGEARGDHYIRLSVNLQHLKLSAESRDICLLAIQDLSLPQCSRAELWCRYQRLHKKNNETNPELTPLGKFIWKLLSSSRPRDLEAFDSSSQSLPEYKGEGNGLYCDISPTSLPRRSTSSLVESAENGFEVHAGLGVEVISIEGRPISAKVGQKNLYAGFDNSVNCTVEKLVIQHFHKEGSWYGLHCEGRHLRHLFWLLLWDEIFSEVPDVFQTPFQNTPLDIYDGMSFYLKRRRVIDEKVQLLSRMSPYALMQQTLCVMRSHFGERCLGLGWESIDPREMLCVAACLGGEVLARLLKEMAMDYVTLSAGLPDLLMMRVKNGAPLEEGVSVIQFDCCEGIPTAALPVFFSQDAEHCAERTLKPLVGNEGESQHKKVELEVRVCEELVTSLQWEAMFVEVKGQNDRLSWRQIHWLRTLASAGAPAKVCLVNYQKKAT